MRKRIALGDQGRGAAAAAPAEGLNWKLFGVAGLTFGGLCLATLFGVLLAREWTPVALGSQAPSVILATQLPECTNCPRHAAPGASAPATLAPVDSTSGLTQQPGSGVAAMGAAPSAAPPPPARAPQAREGTARTGEVSPAASAAGAAGYGATLPESGI